MENVTVKTHTVSAAPDHQIPVYLWEPAGAPTIVIQVFHGLGEHSARYDRFAQAAVDRGYAVCAHDHRGHGPQASNLGFFAPSNGWDRLVSDAHLVTEFLQKKYAQQAIVLLGHSMGSYIAQSYAMRFGDELSALVLSGSTWPDRATLVIGRLVARILSWRHGKLGASPLLDQIGFGNFNKRFEPARTELDWLSRESSEVDAYINDPLCGGPYTTGLWIDLLGGLLEISTNKALQKIPSKLPILITGGSDDPVGGKDGMTKLSEHYEITGHGNLSTKIYAGGRHEMLNETNRDEFTGELLEWISQVPSNYQP
jgi:alpha-beta hydrolase superfamily lysophospholipase